MRIITGFSATIQFLSVVMFFKQVDFWLSVERTTEAIDGGQELVRRLCDSHLSKKFRQSSG